MKIISFKSQYTNIFSMSDIFKLLKHLINLKYDFMQYQGNVLKIQESGFFQSNGTLLPLFYMII